MGLLDYFGNDTEDDLLRRFPPDNALGSADGARTYPSHERMAAESHAERKRARGNALMAFGAGLLDAQRGREGQALGRGLLGAASAYQGALESARDRQIENLKRARLDACGTRFGLVYVDFKTQTRPPKLRAA